MNTLPLLSTGQQEFATIRQTQRIYIDKTQFIHQLLLHDSIFFFLARSRRFGKSLLVNTFKELFLGRKELFEGLYIYDKIAWEQYPVLHFDFSNLDFGGKGLEKVINDRLSEIAESYQVLLKETTIGSKFKELMQELHAKNKSGFHLQAEVSVATGRLDALIIYQSRVYIFEFKLNDSAENAIKQIHQKMYYKSFQQEYKDIYLLGNCLYSQNK